MFNINNQIITFDNSKFKIVEKSKNYLRAKFTFTEDWNGVIKTAVFVSAKGDPYNVILENDECSVPWEIIEYPYFTVSVFGGDLITANKVIVYVLKSGYCEGEVPGEPTPDVYIQILNSIKSPYIGEDKYWYVWDVDKKEFVNSGVSAEGTNSDDGPVGGVGEATDDGGEIFNDYVSNRALSKNASAKGTRTLSGCKGYWYSNINVMDKTITLSIMHEEVSRWDGRDTGWSVGNKISLTTTSTKYYNCSTITNISGNIIKVDELPFSAYEYEYDDGFDGNVVYTTDNPDKGIVDIGISAHAEGGTLKNTELTEASGAFAHAEGRNTKAYGFYSHAEGRNSKAGYAAHAEGQSTHASGEGSHAEGQRSEAIGDASHAGGISTKAVGRGSHVEGHDNRADADFSHAEGGKIEIFDTAEYGHGEGYNNDVKGRASHAEGIENTASGEAAHAEGFNTAALAFASHSSGEGTYATERGQFVIGRFNHVETFETFNPENYVFIIGCGTSVDDRVNAFTVDWNGNGVYKGHITSNAIILKSSNPGSTKKFKITIDDDGMLSSDDGILKFDMSNYVSKEELENALGDIKSLLEDI